ncbi:natterin-3-like [Ornithodoros turicata]|uniref:natterin-3-like n=1 Tax=Ornithodoros turicata TaxID=34597 RepID=UPI003139ED52
MSGYTRTSYRKLCHWVSMSDGRVPAHAVVGGIDSGSDIYIGRAEHDGDIIPGKVVPSHNVCYVPHGGREHAKPSYQVLVALDESHFGWERESGGRLPPGAVQGGATADGEPLYIGRTYHDGTLTIGKIQCSHGSLYIPHGGDEHKYSDYQVLVCRNVNF